MTNPISCYHPLAATYHHSPAPKFFSFFGKNDRSARVRARRAGGPDARARGLRSFSRKTKKIWGPPRFLHTCSLDDCEQNATSRKLISHFLEELGWFYTFVVFLKKLHFLKEILIFYVFIDVLQRNFLFENFFSSRLGLGTV